MHEARGLDVNPNTIARFVKAGDTESVEKLKIIHSVSFHACQITSSIIYATSFGDRMKLPMVRIKDQHIHRSSNFLFSCLWTKMVYVVVQRNWM